MPVKKIEKQPKRSYGKYLMEIDDELYAVVRLPLGNGKYKRKTKKLSTLGSGGKGEAVKWALDQLEKWEEGDQTPKGDNVYFSNFAKWYKAEYLNPPVYSSDGKKLEGTRTYQHQRLTVERLKKEFGVYKLEKITLDVLRAYKRKRLKDVSITTINREFTLLRKMFKKAKARKWLAESPFDLDEPLIEIALESSRNPPLTTRIAKRLLARSRKSEQPLLHYLVLVAMHTGARPSEVMPYDAYTNPDAPREPLNWKAILDFNYKAVRLVSYKGKQRKERIVPTSVELERGLRKMYLAVKPDSKEDLLFPFKNVKRSWNTLCKSVKCTGVWLRDFRHYFNSKILVNESFNDMERLLLMGQTRLETNSKYSHLDESFIKKFRKVTSGEDALAVLPPAAPDVIEISSVSQ